MSQSASRNISAVDEFADRLALRTLVDKYAQCADRRDAKGQMALFTADCHFIVFMDSKAGAAPAMDFHRREDLAPVFADLLQYEATTHMNGQSTITIDVADRTRATGESYCIAHHVKRDADQKSRSLFVASLRYHDVFAKQADGQWLFAERKLLVDWMDTRKMNP